MFKKRKLSRLGDKRNESLIRVHTPSWSAQPSVTSYVSSHGFCSVLLNTFEKLSNIMKCILYADIQQIEKKEQYNNLQKDMIN